MYRIAIMDILGFVLRGNGLRIHPCIPKSWTSFEIDFRFGRSQYHVYVNGSTRTIGASQDMYFDGQLITTEEIQLRDDGGLHEILIRLN
jgi:cellobiose phosphorylase